MRIFWGIIFLLAGSSARAQDSLYVPQWSLIAKPLGVFNPFTPNVLLGALYRIDENAMLELSAGPIFYALCQTGTNAGHVYKKGFKIGSEFKYAPSKWVYFAFELYYKRYIRTELGDVWRYALSYRQRMDIDYTAQDLGGHFKAGHIFTRPSGRFFLDLNYGLGVRRKSVDLGNLPEDAERIDTGAWDFFRTDEPGLSAYYPSITFGVTLGYKLL